MQRMYKIIAACAGIGYIKGGGTVVAAITAMAWYYLMPHEISWQIGLTTLVFLMGVAVSHSVEKAWGKDSSKVVIDEVLGMMVSLVFLPVSLPVVALGFIGFRFFDIVKPLGIRKAESLKGGWGVMLDDLWAGVYTNIAMQLLVYGQIIN